MARKIPDDRFEQLIDTATQVFIEQGYRRTQMADIADAKWRGRRGEHLDAIEAFAVRGRLGPELMHRLVTVLDALDYQIPIANAILTTENLEQALARQTDKGRDAARVAVEMAHLLQEIG